MKAAPRRIVVGVDEIGAGHDPVLSAAVEQAWWSDAELCLVHALPVGLPEIGVPASTALRPHRTARPAHIHAVTAELHHDLAGHLSDERPIAAVRLDVRYGDPATVLLMAAQQANLIILGTRDPRRTDRRSPFLLGSVSQDVALNAICPVMLIPRNT
jgi:nucleotide-binding universal stress UspA family protein